MLATSSGKGLRQTKAPRRGVPATQVPPHPANSPRRSLSTSPRHPRASCNRGYCGVQGRGRQTSGSPRRSAATSSQGGSAEETHLEVDKDLRSPRSDDGGHGIAGDLSTARPCLFLQCESLDSNTTLRSGPPSSTHGASACTASGKPIESRDLLDSLPIRSSPPCPPSATAEEAYLATPLVQPTRRPTSAVSARRYSDLSRGGRGYCSARGQAESRGQRSSVSTRGATLNNGNEHGRRGTCPAREAAASEQPSIVSPSQELQRRLRCHEEEIARLREQLWDSTRECDRLRDRAAAAELLLAGGSASTMPEDGTEAEGILEKTAVASVEVRSQSVDSSMGEAAAVPSDSADSTAPGSSARVAPMGSGAVFFRKARSNVVRSTSAPPLQGRRRSPSPQVTQAGAPSHLTAANKLQPRPPSAEPAVSVALKTAAAHRPGVFMPSAPITRATLPVHTAGVYQHRIEKEALLLQVRGLAQQGTVPSVVQQTMATGQQQSSAHQSFTQPKAGQQPMMQQQIMQQTPQPVTHVKSQPTPQPMSAHSVVQSLPPSIPHLKANGSPLPTLHPLVISPRNSTKASCGPAAVGKGLVFKMAESPTASPNMMQFRYTPDMEMVAAFGNTATGPIAACAAPATARTRRGETPVSGHPRC